MHKGRSHSASETLSGGITKPLNALDLQLDYCLEQSFTLQSKSLLCVELVLTHEYARERVGNTYHRGNTYPREGEQISLLVHQGEHISPRAWLEISVRRTGGTHISATTAHNCGDNSSRIY